MQDLPHEARPRTGFTIVEMLIIIGIMVLLMGILLPALSGSTRRAHKLEELNRLRQVGVAWTAYSNNHNDSVLPGHLDVSTQQGWHVTYRFPNHGKILPAPDYAEVDPISQIDNHAGSWPWRLLPYLDYDVGPVLGHRASPDMDALELEERSWEIRETPAFGYNALFMGGIWGGPRSYLFQNGGIVRNYGLGESDRRFNVVARTVSSVHRSADVMTFTSSAPRLPGVYKYEQARDDEDGFHLVMPPTYLQQDLWGEARLVAKAPQIVEVYGSEELADLPPW